jgi:two-component system, NarL family, sensor kinase
MFQEEMNLTLVMVIGSIISLVLVFGFFLFLAKMRRRQLRFRDEKKQIEVRFQQEILQTRIEIQEQTLTTISGEIHDNIGQILSLAKLNLNTLGNFSDAAIQEKTDATITLISKAISDLRDLSHSLHGDKIADIGLEKAIAGQLKIIANSGQFATLFTSSGERFNLLPQQEMVLFRIVQEALNNAVKYSKAKNINTAINYAPRLLTIAVIDDGSGFSLTCLTNNNTGIGFKNMKSRAALIGALFSLDSAPGCGTKISVSLPT